jgi:hypothetical protein
MTFTTRGRKVEVKVKGEKFDPMQHPRDRFGRFIETGAEVRIVGGFLGRVIKNVGAGNIEVRRSDGKDVIVNRGHLTVVARPNGDKPVSHPVPNLTAAPVQVASPNAEHVDEHGNAPSDGPEAEAAKPNRLSQVAGAAQTAADLANDPDHTTPSSTTTVYERGTATIGGESVPVVRTPSGNVYREDPLHPGQPASARSLPGPAAVTFAPTPTSTGSAIQPAEGDLFGPDAIEPTDADVQEAAAADDPPTFDFQPDAKAPEPEEPQEVETMETVYDIRSDGLNAAIDSINKANARAERAGIEDRFTYQIETYKQRIPSGTPGVPDQIEVRHRLTLNRPTIQHDGWTFAATLTWDPEAGLVTRTVPGATLFNRPEARQCDVCHSQRDRRDTYIVQKGDEQQQVGSSCLQQFMGISPSGLWMLGFEPDTGGGGEGGGGGGGVPFNDRRFDSQQMLALSFAVARDTGWISRGRAQSMQTRSTSDRVADILTGSLPSRDPARAEEQAWQEKMKREAVGLMDDAQSILDTARTMDGDSDYASNLRSVAQPDTVSGRNMPLLASAIAVHQRIQEQEAARRAAREQQEQNPSQHVGEKGGKIKDHEATVLGVRYIDGAYGVTTLLTFSDNDGNVLKWFASGRKDDISVGDTVKVSGTVKDHGEFRGVAETVLTRAKYVPTGDTKTRRDAEAAQAAAARAEADAQEAAYERYETTPLADGNFVPVDDPSSIPIGTFIRWDAGNSYGHTTYRNGYIVSGPEKAENSDLMFLRAHPVNHTQDGRDVVVVGTSGYVVDLDSITGISKHQDPTTGSELADSYFDQAPVPGGFTEVHDGSASLGQIGAGTTVRIRGGGFNQYVNVTVLSRSGDTFTVRYPDGHEDTISADTIKSAALHR